MATTGNRTIASRKAIEKDPNYKRIKKVFTTQRSKPVAKKGKNK
jgi:hypothetical protein